jgi:tetratricopeptide (TPR) repeat protein
VDPGALEAVLRDNTASLEGTSFLGRTLGPEVARDPFGVTHASPDMRQHVRLVLADPEAGEAGRLAKVARVVLAKGKAPATPAGTRFGLVNGVTYIELDAPRASSVATRMQVARLSTADVKKLVAALARSVGGLHKRGAFHGAIKPRAAYLTAQGIELRDAAFSGWSRWRLDLARSVAASPRGGAVLEAIACAAPEQLAALDAASARHAAPHNDVYGLGVLLFALLTGDLPYSGPTFDAVLQAVLGGSPVRPRKLVPDMPRGLEEIVLGCLAKSPHLRPPGAFALAELLEAAESRETTKAAEGSDGALLALHHASDASGVRPPAPPPRSSWRPLALVSVLLIAIVVGAGIAYRVERTRTRDMEILRGDELLARHDTAGAVVAFERALSIDPACPGLEQRVEAARSAAVASKKAGTGRSLLAKALAATPRSTARHDLLREAIHADPGLVEARRALAAFFVEAASDEPRGSDRRKSLTGEARDALDQLAKAGGASAADALLEARWLELERLDPRPALARAARSDERSSAGLGAAAELAFLDGRHRDAAIYVERALGEAPADASLLLLRARVRRVLGEGDRARTDLEAALAAAPDSRRVRAAALEAALEARELERAQHILEERPDAIEHDPDLLAARAYLELLSGHRDAAGEDAGRALALDAHSAWAHLVRARLALLKGDVAAGLKELGTDEREAPLDTQVMMHALDGQDLADVGPERAELLVDIAQALDQSANRARALSLVDKALALAPEDLKARALRAQVFSGLGDHERALLDADWLVQHAPDDLRGHAVRARVLEALDRPGEAMAEYDRLVALAPDQLDFRGIRGIALYAQRRFDEARADLNAFLDSNPPLGPLVERARAVLEKIR